MSVYDDYEMTIGIECHVQLATKTKLFSSSDNDARDAEPNSKVTPIDFGLPGMLPVLNREAVTLAIKAGKALNADIFVVVAFRMLPEVVWNMPPMGTFNLHSSLLPQYRGAAPINWAIINGEKETGVTTFFLSHEIDTGIVLFREKTVIDDADDAGTLHDRLMAMGAKLVLKTVDAILDGEIDPIPQENLVKEGTGLKGAPKIFKEDCKVDWNKAGEEVRNFIRGLSPYPAAWTELAGTGDPEKSRFKLFAGEFLRSGRNDVLPGSILTDNRSYMDVAVKDGVMRITDIQLTGKKRMSTTDFLNGYRFEEGSRFD